MNTMVGSLEFVGLGIAGEAELLGRYLVRLFRCHEDWRAVRIAAAVVIARVGRYAVRAQLDVPLLLQFLDHPGRTR